MGHNKQILTICYLELTKDTREVMAHRDVANRKALGYLFIFHPSPNKTYDFAFTWRQSLYVRRTLRADRVSSTLRFSGRIFRRRSMFSTGAEFLSSCNQHSGRLHLQHDARRSK